MQEYEGKLQSNDNPELHNSPTIAQWQKLVDEATTQVGQKLGVASDQKQFMRDAGFVDVRDDIYKACVIPIEQSLTNDPGTMSRCQVVAGHKIQS